jgi:hypothetical protein
MDLSAIKFAVDTTELDRAGKAIGELVTNVGKLDKAARTAAQTEATLARAAKDSAKANLDNAKAQDTRLKSTITADKADQQAAAAIERKTKATERASTAIKKNADMLQLQNDTYDFILEGFSKGDAKVLAMAKATGQLSDQLKQVLTDIRQFSKNTFDQTETGLDRMVKSAKEASSAQGFLNNGLNLTSKQAKELSNDLDRLNIRLQHQGKSYQEITKEQAIYKQRFVEEANAVNRATSALAAVEKQRKGVVSATNYLTQAEAKMAAALNTSNVALDKAGTDSLVKYEAALRKSGISQDAATAKLATYKAQLTQVAGLEEKRRAQHLARALQPQFTDIAVSLYSGQAPLTVLLQQSGQMVDLFNLSGIEAANLGKAMREAFASMIPAIATVAKGLTSLVFESFMSAGSAVTRFVGNVTGITAAMEIAKRAIVSGGEANFKYIASLDKIGKTFSAVAATGIAAMIAGMILLGLEYKKIIQAEAELTNALATSGGALDISKTEAIAAAEGMTSLGVGTLKAVAAITEIAKAGNIGKESLELITKSAIDLEKTAGISIEETAKQFAKLQEEPAKALTEIAQKTGLVDKATLDYAYALEQQGDKTEAARVATLALASANAQVAAEVRDNWSPIEVLWNDIKSAIGSVKQEIYDLTTSNAVVGALRTVWETVAVVISEVWFTIKGVGKEIGGIGAQIAAVMQGDFSGAAEIGRMMKADAASAAEEQKKYVDAILNRTSVEQKSFNQSKQQNSQYAKWRKENDQALDKSISKTDKYKAKELEMQKDVLAGTVSQIEADKALAGWKKIILGEEKTKKDPSENYFATLMREATASSIKAEDATKSLTASQVKLLEAVNDPRFLKLSKVQQEAYLSTMAANAGKEQQIALTNAQSDAEERLLRLLGKSSGIGRQYYTDMANMEKDAALLGKSREEIEELTRAIFVATPAWKDYEKALEDVNSAARKFNEDSIASQAATLKENESLDYRISLLGKTTEEQKALSTEYNRANKIADVRIKLAKQLRDIEADIDKAKKKGLPESDYRYLIDAQVQARKDAAEQEKAINREVAVQAAEDYDAEFKKIKSTVSESITAALFDGGKAGSSKIKDYLKTELRKRITLSIDAFINPIMGTVAGALGFGSSGSSSTSNGGGNVFGVISNGFSALNGGIATGISNAFSKFAGSSVGQSLGLSNSTAIVGNNPSAYVPEGGQLTSLGQNIGTAAGMIGSGLAGYGISSAISGGYTTGGNTVNVLAGVSSAFLGPIAGVIGGVVNRAFGRKLADSGIQGTFGTQGGFSGESYQFYKGGWFRSDKTKTSEMDAALAKTLGTAFTQMITQVGTLGTVLGLNTDKLKDFSTTFKISFQGLQEEEIQGKIQEALATANNEMAEQILGTWSKTTKEVTDVIESISGSGEGTSFENITRVVEEVSYTASPFAREGEKAIDTLTRLAGSLSSVNTAFDTLGYTLYDASLVGGDMASKLVDLFGNLETFTASASSYYQNFYTEAEKQETMVRQLTKAFGEYNLELPSTRDAFRQIVESQDLTTEAGREMFKNLMALQNPLNELFNTFSETMKSLKEDTANLEIELLRAKGDTAGANAAQRALDTQGFTEAEIAVYDYNTALRAQIKALEDAAESVEKLSSSIVDEINRLRGYTDTSGNSPQALIAEFDRLTTLARGGDANAFNSLGDTSKLLDEYYKNTATSAVQYAYQRSVLANSLEQSYNTAKASGATFSGTSSLMGTPALSAPVVSSVSSANAAGSSGLADLLSAVVTELTMLRAEVRADVAHNAKTAKILERVTPEGDALATRNEG